VATKKVKLQDREVLGQEINFRIVEDATIALELEDGALLRVRPVIVSVIRTEEKNSDGERMYFIQTFTHVSVAKPGKDDVA
jgi:hypothetical protein